MKISSLILIASVTACTATGAELQFKQRTNGGQPVALSSTERAELGDPFFRLVLKEHAEVTVLKDILKLLEPDAARRRVFVVDEQIVNRQATGSRRAVIDFTATELQGNVMISPSMLPDRFPSVDDELEVWGWDGQRGRYNYYRMDRDGSNAGPVWKSRGSSDGADKLTPQQRSGTCFACHLSGGPVMKELFRPWNNWNSFDSVANYLTPTSPNPWPVAAKIRDFGVLTGAEGLETPIFQALQRFNSKRLDALLKRQSGADQPELTAEGHAQVLDGQRMLRPLFETVECNLISALKNSALHRFNADSDFVPTLQLTLPSSVFLNVSLIAGGQLPVYSGLKIVEADSFSQFAKLTQQDNKELVTNAGLGLLGRRPGDAQFAWFGPEASHVDNDFVDQCLKRGVITPHFLAAALAVDLETPVFSKRRIRLKQFLPATFEFKPRVGGGDPVSAPRDAASDFLTAAVIQRIEASNPSLGTAEAEFLQLLKSPDAVPLLTERVIRYRDRVKAALSGDPAVRKAELTRLFGNLVAARKAMLDDPIIATLDETGNLFPRP